MVTSRPTTAVEGLTVRSLAVIVDAGPSPLQGLVVVDQRTTVLIPKHDLAAHLHVEVQHPIFIEHGFQEHARSDWWWRPSEGRRPRRRITTCDTVVHVLGGHLIRHTWLG